MTPKSQYYETLANTMIKNFEKRRMEAYYCPTAKEAVAKALSFVPAGSLVAHGGSMTLEEIGMIDALRSADINFLDRAVCQTPEDSKKMFHDALVADYYFMSTNAMTIDGELVNIDGNGNRVAALIYGPENVIILAGMNKAAKNVDEAIDRVHLTATPMNCARLNKKTPCTQTGVCADCLSPDCICNQVVITRRSGIAGRIRVILIGEELGY